MAAELRVLIDHTFLSDREELSALPKKLEAIRTKCPISDEKFYNLVVAMTEAVANAINHGNQGDSTKSVRYTLECTEQGIKCLIEDEGKGFDLDAISSPVEPENLLSEGGRGMFIINALMQNLRVEPFDGGTRVEFVCPRS